MSDYREQCVKAKSKRAGIVEQRPGAGASKKDRPIILESRPLRATWLARRGDHWSKWGAYRSVREAEKARDNLSRKYATIWEFRVKPEQEVPSD
jgi:hypothetical protein